MKKKKEEKRYIVAYQEWDDMVIKTMTGEKIRTFIKADCRGDQFGIFIIEGNMIKSGDNKIDLSKL